MLVVWAALIGANTFGKKPWESPDSVAFDVPIFSGNMVILQSVDTWNECCSTMVNIILYGGERV